uniref:C2H2-type domain-containing protein n=1 Tax=Leersia perrieri TaxID=77586 RepID=A0A0D9Y0U0_9ORYZ
MAFECQICGDPFDKRSDLNEHERICSIKDNPVEVECIYCQELIKNNYSRKQHELQCKKNLHRQTEPSGSAQGGTDLFSGIHITRQKRTARIELLPEQRVKKPASDYAQGVIDDAPGNPQKPTTSEVKADPSVNVPGDRDPSVMQRQKEKLGDSSDHKTQTDSFSPIDDLSDIATNSEKQIKTIDGGVDTRLPENRHPSTMQTQSKLPDLNLLPHNDSFCSMDDNALVRADTDSDKEKNTDNDGVLADTNSDKDITGNGGVPADKNSNEQKKTDNGGVPADTNSDKEKKTDNGGVPADTNSDKEKTDNGGADINNPQHKDPSVMEVQNKLDLNLPPRNDSFSSMDNLKTLSPIDTNSDKETNTINACVDTNSDKETNTVDTGVDANSDKETNTVNAGVDINDPDDQDPPAKPMGNKLGLNLLPRSDSSDSSV